MNEKLIVFSADALVREDIAYLEQKPNFARLMTHSAQVERVKSIYPSLTYPCHATMFTGCYPDKHGVITNKEFLTWDDGVPHYLTAAADIRAENLFAAAKRAVFKGIENLIGQMRGHGAVGTALCLGRTEDSFIDLRDVEDDNSRVAFSDEAYHGNSL